MQVVRYLANIRTVGATTVVIQGPVQLQDPDSYAVGNAGRTASH